MGESHLPAAQGAERGSSGTIRVLLIRVVLITAEDTRLRVTVFERQVQLHCHDG